tara:strand:+ start:13298 stop:13510 length:213 start_codon:yes stop_codon:yes gene_type:complete
MAILDKDAERIFGKIEEIENSIRILKTNDLHHISLKLKQLEGNQKWIRSLLLGTMFVIVASAIGIIFSNV